MKLQLQNGTSIRVSKTNVGVGVLMIVIEADHDVSVALMTPSEVTELSRMLLEATNVYHDEHP